MKCGFLVGILLFSCISTVPTHQAQTQADRVAVQPAGAGGAGGTGTQEPKQERRNRLVPDFKPFHHPSSKVSDSRLVGQGPISSVQWLELVPLFGNLHSPPPPTRKPQSNKLVIILGVVGGGTALVLGYFFLCKPKVDDKEERRKEQLKRRDTLLVEEQHGNQVDAVEHKHLLFAQTRRENQEFTNEVIKVLSEESPKPIVRRAKAIGIGKGQEPFKQDSESIKTKIGDKSFVADHKKENIKANDDCNKHFDIKKVAETKAAVLNIKESGGGDAEVKTSKIESKKNEKERSRKISYARQISAEGDFESKAKSFKLSKVPKTHSCSVTEHGVLSEVLNILDVVELQRCEKLNTAIHGVLADLSIEGANLSRLRITDVQEKGESEFVSKTMTMKEYLVSIANKKIEDAVKLVREDCSLENIKNLADTIKKYRPETNTSSTGV